MPVAVPVAEAARPLIERAATSGFAVALAVAGEIEPLVVNPSVDAVPVALTDRAEGVG